MRTLLWILIGAAGLVGASRLAGSPVTTDGPPRQEPSADAQEAVAEDWTEEARDPEEIRVELRAARRARLALEAQQAIETLQQEVRLAEARHALESARADLDAFETHRLGASIAESELELVRNADYSQDASEEMEQLAQMYGENELADRTAEIVLRRARRELERAEEEQRLATAEHRHQIDVALPRELRDLRQAAFATELDLRLAELEQYALTIEQRNALEESDEEIRALEEELATAATAAEEK